MSTQQIPTLAQLVAVRKTLWHQQTGPVPSEAETEQELVETEPPAAELGDADGVEAEPHEALEVDGAEGVETTDEDGEDALDGEDDAEGEPEDAAALSDEDEAEPAEVEASPATVAQPASAAVRTMEAARALVEQAGLLPFAPIPALAAAPMPSLVEATLGEAKSAPTLEESATARSLLARLIAEGSAVPLNLLGQGGTTGEAPDFVASASAFPYVFTLRGDKGWKQLPETSGASKVSPLAVNTYALLVEGGPQSAYALTGVLGKGLTEQAVVRALTELWQQLRVIPVPQPSGKPTLWEPITSRLLRQVKAGANAGQPTALSALISLYLGQAVLATEDEIEVFLSTVAPRSRVRDVVHALMAAQELETMAIDGRQNLYVAGALPEFDTEPVTEPKRMERGGPTLAEDGSRIRRMVKSTRPDGERAKPFRQDRPGAGGGRPAFGGARGGGFAGRGERGGKPAFARGGDRPERGGAPRFDRPWEENKRPARPAEGVADDVRAGSAEAGSSDRAAGRPFRPQGDRPGRMGGDRPAFRRGADGGGDRPRPSFDRSGPAGERPRFGGPRAGGAFGGPRRGPAGEGGGFAGPRGDRGPRSFGGDGERRPFRPADREGRPGGAERPRGGFGGGDRPERGGFGGPRREDRGGRPGGFEGERSAGGRPGGFKPGGFRPGGPRPGGAEGAGGAGRPPFRKFDAPRDGERPFRPRRPEGAEGGSRGFGGGDRPSRPAGDRPFRPAGERPFRPAGDRPFAPRPGGRPGGAGDAGARPFRPAGGGGRFAAGAAGDRGPKRPFSRREDGGGARPGAGGGAAGGGPFDKFKDGNKPWGKRPPKRKIKPEGEDA